MNVVNNVALEIEGIDKSGKDTLYQYLGYVGNFAYTLNVRGVLSNLVYNTKFNRDYTYKLVYKPFIVFLDVEEKDWEYRCRMTHEPKIPYNADRDLFLEKIALLESKGITVLKYNTTQMTPYNIAVDVIDKLSKINLDDYICKEIIELK